MLLYRGAQTSLHNTIHAVCVLCARRACLPCCSCCSIPFLSVVQSPDLAADTFSEKGLYLCDVKFTQTVLCNARIQPMQARLCMHAYNACIWHGRDGDQAQEGVLMLAGLAWAMNRSAAASALSGATGASCLACWGQQALSRCGVLHSTWLVSAWYTACACASVLVREVQPARPCLSRLQHTP